MKNLLILLFTTVTFCAYAQKGTIRGTIIEDETGETVIGANILVQESGKGTTTDLDGQFSIEIAPGTYTLQITYLGFQNITISETEVKAGEVTILGEIRLLDENLELDEVVVTAKAIRTTEVALMTIKKKSPAMLDGISSSKMQLTGDATAVEAAKRVTGVSVEGGKYIYVRGLGDRYSKTTLNGMEIPGLDPDRNTLQMDIFPTNLIDNIMVSKNFTAEMPADFTGGLLNVETKDFPEEKIFNISLSTSFNPSMHLNSDYLTYEGGDTDWLGFDDGARELPAAARAEEVPTPINSQNNPDAVTDFVNSFNPELGAFNQTSLVDYSAGISLGNQITLGKDKEETENTSKPKLGYIFSLSYRNSYTYYDDVFYGEYQRQQVPVDEYEMVYATTQEGQLGKRNVLIGALGGLAYKTKYSKLRLTAMRLQNGESTAGEFFIDNNGEAVGQSGYIADSDNLEYGQRSLTNFLLNGTHVLGESGWEIDWRLSPTLSESDDPDIRKTAFTIESNGTFFVAGAGGNPTRIWRSLNEVNGVGRLDITKSYSFAGEDAKFKVGGAYTYKDRDYEILFFDMQFNRSQSWPNPDPEAVIDPRYIYPNTPNSIYYQSGNNTPNPNEYQSDVTNIGAYVSNEFNPFEKLKTILGLRMENFVQNHTGRDQLWANGDFTNGNNLDNEEVLNSLDLFPSANFIYSLTGDQNIRAAYSRTIARPSFKELSFAQILDPITNRIFNGSLFNYTDWEGNLTETRINNFDLRWELFMQGGQLISVSGFFKQFDNPIELVRIPEAQTTTEFQPRNVGDGLLYGVELEIRKNLDFISPSLEKLNVSGNFTFVESQIDMTVTEFNARKNFEREGETIEDTRQIGGRAPWVVNAGITYGDFDNGLDIGLFYNVKGQTLQIVGSGLYPDIYYEPFHSLNFSINKKFGKEQKTAIDFSVSNMLNDKIESVYSSFRAEDQLFSRFSPGIAFGVGLSHNF